MPKIYIFHIFDFLKPQEINLLNFNDVYPSEENCKLKFKEMRDKHLPESMKR